MRTVAVVFSCVALLLVGLNVTGYADSKTVLISGGLQGAEAGGWGSGSIELDEEETYLEGEAWKVQTTGFFEGGRLGLTPALDADQFLADPAGGYVRLVVKVHEPVATTPMGPAGGMPPGAMEPWMMEPGMMPPEAVPGGVPIEPWMMAPEAMPGTVPGAVPGAMPGAMPPEAGMVVPPGAAPMPEPWVGEPGMAPPGMEPGMMPPGMVEPGMMPGEQPGVAQAPPAKIEQLRVLVVTDKGALDSGPIQLSNFAEIVEDWVQVVVPLSAFKGADVTGGQIQHIALFGDVEETFWVGELEIGYEEQPLLADAGQNITTKVNAPTEFTAAPQPEGVRASYTWDFDDLDGIQEEGYGREATWTFLTPGYYVVTLTVSDPDGRKVSRIDRIHVKVEE
ncbi:MAG: PKD domain-containing protein [Armatimonadota bacterium]